MWEGVQSQGWAWPASGEFLAKMPFLRLNPDRPNLLKQGGCFILLFFSLFASNGEER
jgi:hypothetical protein